MNHDLKSESTTPLEVAGHLSRIVTQAADRALGDRRRSPLGLYTVLQNCLDFYGIDSRIMYGQAAWIEIHSDNQPHWVGHFDESQAHFWLQTEHAETVDLIAAVSCREKDGALYSVPLLWCKNYPTFYEYHALGIAESSEEEKSQLPADVKRMNEWALGHIKEPQKLDPDDLHEYPPEAWIGPNQQLLDDPKKSYQHLDRALQIFGLPPKIEFQSPASPRHH